MVKRLDNKTTYHVCSLGKGKTTKWKNMIGQRDGDDGMNEPRLIWKKLANKNDNHKM